MTTSQEWRRMAIGEQRVGQFGRYHGQTLSSYLNLTSILTLVKVMDEFKTYNINQRFN